MVQQHNLPLALAVTFVTDNPARAMHLDKKKGTLRVGKDADLLVVDSRTLEIECVIARGRVLKAPGWTARGMFEK